MTVLVVDDSAAFRSRVRRHLDQDGAIAVVGQADVLRAVKRLVQDSCVVVLTSDGSALVRERCETLSADAVIDKAHAATLMIPTLRRMFAPRGERNPG